MKLFFALFLSVLFFLPFIPTTHAQSVPVCLAEITYAQSPITKICKSFSSSCEVPSGWTRVQSCPTVTTMSNEISFKPLYFHWGYGTASVRVGDQNNNPVYKAFVTGRWSGGANTITMGTTQADGSIMLASPITTQNSSLTFCVTSIYLSGYSYIPSTSACASN